MTKRPALFLAAALTLTLAACSGSQPEAPVANVEDNAVIEEVPADEGPVINALPTEEPTANATTAATVRDDRSEQAQMYDDADATGMTARVDRGNAAGDQSAPVDAADKK